MKYLLLSDLQLGISDLLDKRHAALTTASAGKTYAPMLAKKLLEIVELPSTVATSKPLVDQLALIDVTHDGFGGALWFMVEAYLRAPSSSQAQVEAASRIRAEFIPQLKDLKESFATEAQAAIQRRGALTTHKADLDLFPLPDGNTLFAWAEQFLDAGKKLDELLSDRADQEENERRGAHKLRTATLGMLTRLRGALADEMEHDPALPRNLDFQVFAYLDQLESSRAVSAAAAKAALAAQAAPAVPAAPSPPPG